MAQFRSDYVLFNKNILMLVPDWLQLSRVYSHYIIAHMGAKLVLLIIIVSQLTTWPQPQYHDNLTTAT